MRRIGLVLVLGLTFAPHAAEAEGGKAVRIGILTMSFSPGGTRAALGLRSATRAGA